MQALVQQVHWLHKPKTKHLFLPRVFALFCFFFLHYSQQIQTETRRVLQPITFYSLLEMCFSGCRNQACCDSIRLAILYPAKLHWIMFNTIGFSNQLLSCWTKTDYKKMPPQLEKSSYGFSNRIHLVYNGLPACKYGIWECGKWNTSEPQGVCVPGLWIKDICKSDARPSDWIRAAYLSCVNCDLMTGRGCLFTAN